MVQLIYNENTVENSTENTFKKIENKLPVLADKRFLQTKSDIYGWFVSPGLALPFYLKRKMGIRRAFVTMGFVYLVNQVSKEDEKQFFDEMIQICRKEKIHIVETAYTNTIFPVFPGGSSYAVLGTFIVDLTLSEEQLFKNLHSKHRNVIRKAQKEGVVVKHNRSYRDICKQLICETYIRQGLVWNDTNELESLSDSLGDNIRFYTAFKDDVPQGCAVILWNSHRGYYLYGGSIQRPSTGAVNLLQWQIICDLRQEKSKEYDFFGARVNPDKGSKVEGIQRFKERFGGTLQTGYKWKLPVNKFMNGFYLTVFFLYNLLKGKIYKGDLIDIEKKRLKGRTE